LNRKRWWKPGIPPLYSAGKCVYLTDVPRELALHEAGQTAAGNGLLNLSERPSHGGALVSTGMLEAMVAGRGAAGLVKSGNKVIANNDYDYAYAA